MVRCAVCSRQRINRLLTGTYSVLSVRCPAQKVGPRYSTVMLPFTFSAAQRSILLISRLNYLDDRGSLQGCVHVVRIVRKIAYWGSASSSVSERLGQSFEYTRNLIAGLRMHTDVPPAVLAQQDPVQLLGSIFLSASWWAR